MKGSIVLDIWEKISSSKGWIAMKLCVTGLTFVLTTLGDNNVPQVFSTFNFI